MFMISKYDWKRADSNHFPEPTDWNTANQLDPEEDLLEIILEELNRRFGKAFEELAKGEEDG